jgi:hypothetical protein
MNYFIKVLLMQMYTTFGFAKTHILVYIHTYRLNLYYKHTYAYTHSHEYIGTKSYTNTHIQGTFYFKIKAYCIMETFIFVVTVLNSMTPNREQAWSRTWSWPPRQ